MWLFPWYKLLKLGANHIKSSKSFWDTAQWLSYYHPDPAALGSIHRIPQKISEKTIVDVAEINQRRCLEESGQWLENNDRTHLVLTSGKQVLQNIKKSFWETRQGNLQVKFSTARSNQDPCLGSLKKRDQARFYFETKQGQKSIRSSQGWERRLPN